MTCFKLFHYCSPRVTGSGRGTTVGGSEITRADHRTKGLPCHAGVKHLLLSLLLKNLPEDSGSVPGSGRCPGEGNGKLLQCSCLGRPMDRGAWWATAQGVAKELEMTQRLNKNHHKTKVCVCVCVCVCVRACVWNLQSQLNTGTGWLRAVESFCIHWLD